MFCKQKKIITWVALVAVLLAMLASVGATVPEKAERADLTYYCPKVYFWHKWCVGNRQFADGYYGSYEVWMWPAGSCGCLARCTCWVTVCGIRYYWPTCY